MANLLVGNWQDVRGSQKYILRNICGTNGKMHVDVLSADSEWKFGGGHLVRIRGDTAFWGSPVDRYFCRLIDIKTAGVVRWYKCGTTNGKVHWEWVKSISEPSKKVSKVRTLHIGSDMFAASEYDPDSWLPVKLIAVVDNEEDGKYLIVSTQSGEHKWTVDEQSAVLCSEI